MIRAPFVLAATGLGLAGVLSYQPPHNTTTPVKQGAGAGQASSSSGAAAPPANAAGPITGAQTATGPMVSYGYGRLSVRVWVAGNKIAAVNLANLQTVDPYSQQLAAQVIPMLRGEVLKLQKGQIYGVSGATYTSQAYAMSLQAALKKLHFA
ncbi:MAG: FMN-binding protein [Mycobacteriales bacterium]